ncbi:MAG: hypothetical protein M1830_001388 [Pleopsidium flavum]|nr:MAG: hypothetical protein M1830_001388 [Pleopsidium flavum]
MTLDSRAKDVAKLFVLPKGASQHARVVTLCNPRTLTAKRYFFCPEKGIYEFTRLAAPKTAPRSCLIAPTYDNKANLDILPQCTAGSVPDLAELDQARGSPTSSILGGHIVESAEFFLATPIDPLFLLLPVLCPIPLSNKSEAMKQVFLSADDLLDSLSDTSRHFWYLVDHAPTRVLLLERIAAVCDSVMAGGEAMYRLSIDKLVKELTAKAYKMVDKGLPETIEARFVRKALEVPIMSVKREESSLSANTNFEPEEESLSSQNGTQTPSESTDSQTSTSTSATQVSSHSSSTTISLIAENISVSAPEGVPQLLRLRTALAYMLASYVPHHLSTYLHESLSSPSAFVDFTPLEQYLSHLSCLRAKALASRSLSDFSRKRSMNEDDEALETRAEKKRKKEEEDKRKKSGESRGVRDLKKVDTTGMKKLSDFFGKGATGNKKKNK